MNYFFLIMKMSYVIGLALIISISCSGLRLLGEDSHSSKAIRCFWMERETFRVFDLKNLKRGLKENLYYFVNVVIETLLLLIMI